MDWCSPSALAAPTLCVIPFSRPEQARPSQRISHELHQHKPPSAAGILERGENELLVLRQRWASSRCWHWLFHRALPMMAIKTSTVRSSCFTWVAYCMPPVPPSVVLPQVKSPRHLGVGLVWRARYKMPVVPSGAAHDIVRQLVEVRASCSRSFLVTQWSEAPVCRARYELLGTMGMPGRCETSVANGCARVGDITLLASSGAALRQPARSLGVACCTLPILPLVVLSWVKGPRRASIGPIERALHRPPFMLGTDWQCCHSVVSRDSYMSKECSPLNRAVIILPDVPPAALAHEDVSRRLCTKGRLTDANAPRSRAFPVIFQSADASGRCGTGIVNINVEKRARERSPFAGVTCHTPPIALLVASPWVKRFSRLSTGLVWRARCGLPCVLGIIRRCYNGVVNENRHMSIRCSPLNGAVLIPPGALPAAHARVGASCLLSHGLGSALALTALVRLLHKAVSTQEREGKQGRSLLRRPMSHLFFFFF